MTKTELRTYAFTLAVLDLPKVAAYFQSALGFKTDWIDGANWHTLSRDGMRVMMGHCPDAIPPADLGDHSYFAYIHIDDVDALHAEWSKNGAIILKPPADKPWGLREMAVGIPGGHRFMIGQVLPTRT
jgi:uncharacterized glyoxalase superfamily protein PhnB